MKKTQSNSARVSPLQIAIPGALLFVSAILFASTFRAASDKSQSDTPPAAAAQGTPAPVTVSLPIDTLDVTAPPSTVFQKPAITTNLNGSLNYVGFQGDFTFDVVP